MNQILTDYGEVSQVVIRHFAASYGVVFPSGYVQLLSAHNGLQFVSNRFEYIVDSGKRISSSFSFCGYGEWSVGEPIQDVQDFDSYGYEGVITIGLCANGDYLCFDYREASNTDNPPVILMFHDQYIVDEHGQTKMEIVKVADDFESFINMLHE